MARKQDVTINISGYATNPTGTDPSGSTYPVKITSGVSPDPIVVHKEVDDKGKDKPYTLDFALTNAPAGYTATITDFRYADTGGTQWWRPVSDPNTTNPTLNPPQGHEFEWVGAQGNAFRITDKSSNVQNYNYVLQVQVVNDSDPTDNYTFIVDPEIHNEDAAHP